MKWFLATSVLILQACSTGVGLKPVNLGPLFHDSNSKVWLVDKVISGNKNFAPRINMDKDVIIFYETGKCMFQPLRTLGDLVGKKGEYSLFSEDKTLCIYYPNEKWDFTITAITEDTIILSPTKESDLKYKMVLVPFPEL